MKERFPAAYATLPPGADAGDWALVTAQPSVEGTDNDKIDAELASRLGEAAARIAVAVARTLAASPVEAAAGKLWRSSKENAASSKERGRTRHCVMLSYCRRDINFTASPQIEAIRGGLEPVGAVKNKIVIDMAHQLRRMGHRVLLDVCPEEGIQKGQVILLVLLSMLLILLKLLPARPVIHIRTDSIPRLLHSHHQ